MKSSYSTFLLEDSNKNGAHSSKGNTFANIVK